MTIDEQIEYLRKGTVDCIPVEDLRRKLERAAANGVPLRVKAGFDPTAPDLHLGHTVLIRKMRHFQQLGHQVIFLIGAFTATIGDPSGRSATRPQLSDDEIQANAETFKQQIVKLLDPEKTELRFNSEWMSRFTAADFVRLSGKATVAQMLEREDFRKRFESQTPISIHELLYPLVQGYDSVALECDIELGGTDQKFNLLMARQIQREYGNPDPQMIMTTPLLEGTDGVQKMSKSLGNYIGITESPREMFGKAMSISDELMWRYYELLTDMPAQEVSVLKLEAASGTRNPRDIKATLAKLIVKDFHSEAAARAAEEDFVRRFRNKEIPEEIEERTLAANSESGWEITELMVTTGLAASKAEARRLIQQGGVSIDGERLAAASAATLGKPGTSVLIKVGKRRFVRVNFAS